MSEAFALVQIVRTAQLPSSPGGIEIVAIEVPAIVRGVNRVASKAEHADNRIKWARMALHLVTNTRTIEDRSARAGMDKDAMDFAPEAA